MPSHWSKCTTPIREWTWRTKKEMLRHYHWHSASFLLNLFNRYADAY